MEAKLAELFPDQIIEVKEYRSFLNQPERIQISSQEDTSDYDPFTLTNYYRFRVKLPRPALNVKTLQLARASLPLAVSSIADPETTFWYYALPKVSTGTLYENNAGTPGDIAFTFDQQGNVFTPVGSLVPGAAVYFDSGTIVLSAQVFTYNKDNASVGNVNVPVIQNAVTEYFIVYAGPVLASPRSNYLRYVRLVATNVQPELMDTFTGGFNRTFTDYDDLVSELNNATTDDPLNGVAAQNNVVGTFKFVPNQIAFSYSSRFNKIVFTGLDQSFSYLPAASDDPIWMEAAAELQTRDRQNTRFNFSGIVEIVQPYQLYRNLTLRLGFTYATYASGDNFISMIRPIPPFIASPPSNLGAFTAYDHVAPGYCDLVYSSCCHLYATIVGGSTVDTILNKAFLASLPLNAPTLGVGFHSLPLTNPLTKIASQLYEIDIEMRTDTGEPFYIGNNGIVSCEFILTY